MTNGEVDGQFNLPEVAIVMIFGHFSNFNFYFPWWNDDTEGARMRMFVDSILSWRVNIRSKQTDLRKAQGEGAQHTHSERPTPHTHTEEGALNPVILTKLQGSRALRSFSMGMAFAQKERGPANSGGPTKEECIIMAERRHAQRRRCLKSCYA